jgi:hypothetical protein
MRIATGGMPARRQRGRASTPIRWTTPASRFFAAWPRQNIIAAVRISEMAL